MVINIVKDFDEFRLSWSIAEAQIVTSNCSIWLDSPTAFGLAADLLSAPSPTDKSDPYYRYDSPNQDFRLLFNKGVVDELAKQVDRQFGFYQLLDADLPSIASDMEPQNLPQMFVQSVVDSDVPTTVQSSIIEARKSNTDSEIYEAVNDYKGGTKAENVPDIVAIVNSL